MGWKRTKLVMVDTSIMSSYKSGGGTGGPRSGLIALHKLKAAAQVPADVAAGLLAAHHAVQGAGGDFRVTDLRREVETQAAARKKYENWLNAGKPTGSAFDSTTMKAAFVAKPGYSFHNAGRAMDVHIQELKFPGLPSSQQLDKLWELVEPLGWRPIIRTANERESEAWHFDFMGEWAPVYDRLGYKDGAMCAALDIGVDCYARWSWRFVQAQLQRAGYDVGEVDGYAGRKTKKGLKKAGIAYSSSPSNLWKKVAALPSSNALLWAA